MKRIWLIAFPALLLMLILLAVNWVQYPNTTTATAAIISSGQTSKSNNMRTVKRIHKASYMPIDDLITYNPLPNNTIRQIDPFLFLNHHGPQTYRKNNKGLPFGPHPHRGMETITFILEGDIMHQDSANHQSIIRAGGVQWMTAGRGLMHAEVSSDEFKQNGGDLEILQLWVNLPKKHKMITPSYMGLQKEDIPFVSENGARVNVLSENYQSVEGPYKGVTDMPMFTLEMEAGATLSFEVPTNRNIFFYVVRGKVNTNGKEISKLNLVEFNNDAEQVNITALETAYIIFAHAEPFNEPVVSRGPFVMNTEEEIQQAYKDFREGKFGTWDIE